MSAQRARLSVWTGFAPEAGEGRGRLDPRVGLRMEHYSTCFTWYELPGVQRWSVALELSYDDDRVAELPSATIATASVITLNTSDMAPWALSEVSSDMSEIAAIISESELVASYGFGPGSVTQIAVIEDLVVDPYWRGAGLGPALILTATRQLGAEAIVLAPFALPTRLGDDGVWHSYYDLPRPGATAQRKVVRAYRAAGFVELAPHVMWLVPTEAIGTFQKQREILARAQDVASTAKARSWYLRRARRRSDVAE